MMTLFRNEGRWVESNAAFDGYLVTRYEKHLASASPDMFFVDYGLSVLSKMVIEQKVPANIESDLATLFKMLSAQGLLAGFEVHDRFYEIGSLQGLEDLERMLGADK